MINRVIETMTQRLADTDKKGALHSDIFIQAGTAHSAHYEDGRIEELASSNADGSGARIIVGDRTFYSHSPGHRLLPYPGYSPRLSLLLSGPCPIRRETIADPF